MNTVDVEAERVLFVAAMGALGIMDVVSSPRAFTVWLARARLAAKDREDEGVWIPCSERMPSVGQKVWYYFDVVGVHYGQYDGDDTFSGRSGFLCGDVTHWMSAPSPPIDTALPTNHADGLAAQKGEG